MNLDPTAALAEAHRDQLLTEARQARLAALVACCRPSMLARRSRALLAWARAGQLGAGYLDPMHPRPAVRDNAYFQTCCAR